MKEGVTLKVMHLRRKDMKEYQRSGLQYTEFYREKGIVEWGVCKWMMLRSRGHENRTRFGRQTRRMWKEWVAQRRITKKAKRRSGGERRVQGEALVRGEREKGRPGILLWALLGLKGPRGKLQSMSGQWYNVHADMVRRDNIPRRSGQRDQCWRCPKEGGQAVVGPEDDSMGVRDSDHALYRCPGTVVGTSATAAKGSA